MKPTARHSGMPQTIGRQGLFAGSLGGRRLCGVIVLSAAVSLLAACGDSGGATDLAEGREVAARDIDGSVVQGRFTARRWCSSCHAVDSDEPSSIEAGAPAFQLIADRPGTTRNSLLAFMDDTHPVYSVGAPMDMPTDVLYEREKADLIAYMLSLRQTGD